MDFAAIPTASQSRDRWLAWPVTVVTVAVFALNLLSSLPGSISFLFIPVFVLGSLGALVTIPVITVFLLVRRRTRSAASTLLALLIPILLWAPINWVTDCLHLGMTVGFGTNSAMARDDGAFTTYDWSTGLAGGPNTFLIRDPTDEMALPKTKHRQRAVDENGFSEECAGKSRHLLGHSYVCTF